MRLALLDPVPRERLVVYQTQLLEPFHHEIDSVRHEGAAGEAVAGLSFTARTVGEKIQCCVERALVRVALDELAASRNVEHAADGERRGDLFREAEGVQAVYEDVEPAA